MKTLHTLVFPLALCAMRVWMGCAQPGDVHLAALGEAKERVEAGMDVLEQWPVDSVAACRERVAMRFKDLDWLVADSTLTFTVDDGQLIGDWARVKRHLKVAPQRIRALNEQGALCNTQLANLIGAIRNGAEVDANGVAMDEVYFQRQAQNELNAVAKWLAFVADTRRLIDAGMVLEAATRAPMDSLLQAKRAEWAQQIAAE